MIPILQYKFYMFFSYLTLVWHLLYCEWNSILDYIFVFDLSHSKHCVFGIPAVRLHYCGITPVYILHIAILPPSVSQETKIDRRSKELVRIGLPVGDNSEQE